MTKLNEIHERLRECKRKLGPYTQISSTPYKICDAEIARVLTTLIDTLLEVVEDL